MAMRYEITDLNKILGQLSRDTRGLFNRLYTVESSTGSQKVPEAMEQWVKERFGSVERVEKQRIISIKNRFTGEHSLFNQLRSDRPIEARSKIRLEELEEKENCLFCNPETQTPADVFGRIRGKYCITASNIAKYDAVHSLIIFKEHNPLVIRKAWIADYLSTGERWFDEVSHYRGERGLQKFFMWNCLWKSGASIIHGHMQLSASNEHYGKLETLEKAAADYNRGFNADYFEDLYTVHKQLGLAKENKGEKILCYLTPIKEKEIFILSKAKRSDDMADTIYTVLKSYLDMGVQSFNLAIFQLHDGHIVRLVDRGSLSDRTSDFGAMELYSASVISSDPFKLAHGIFS
jgi:galactose-1-phosphate uridylyltransferase